MTENDILRTTLVRNAYEVMVENAHRAVVEADKLNDQLIENDPALRSTLLLKKEVNS